MDYVFTSFTGFAAFQDRYNTLVSEISQLSEAKSAALSVELQAADDVLKDVSTITSLVSAAAVQLCDIDFAAHAQSLAKRIRGISESLAAQKTAPLESFSLDLVADTHSIVAEISRLGHLR